MKRTPPRRAATTALLATAAALLTACSAPRVDIPWLHVAVGPSPSPQASPVAEAPTAAPTPEPTVAAPQITIQQFVPIAERFVEQHRGHAFKTPVTVTLLGDADFRKRLLSDQGTDTSAIATASKELKALHLIDKTVDLGSAATDLLGAGVSGFYDPKSKSLVVRGAAATPYVRQVLVHELTHALQDQYFGIDRPALDKTNDEQASAFQAVVEGDAVRIENEYHAAMTTAEQDQADREEQQQGAGISSSIPQVLIEMLTFPYIAGPLFMERLDQYGGTAEVDRAFTHPPVSTEQVLNVNAYIAGRAPIAVAQPHADATAFDHGVNGEFGVILYLEKAGLSGGEARGIADLWGGDAYVAWNSGAGACVRQATVADTPADQPTLDQALGQYAQAIGARFVASPGGGTPSVLTACG